MAQHLEMYFEEKVKIVELSSNFLNHAKQPDEILLRWLK
jgi:hypothetical protein